MITGGIIVLGGAMFLYGNYTGAFWLIVLSIISGLGAVVKAFANPDWYLERRAKAGLENDLFNPNKHIIGLAINKAVIVVPLALIAWWLAGKAGYL